MSRRRRLALVALAVAVTCWTALGAGVRASRGARVSGDEPYYLLTAISLAEDRDLDITDELAAGRWRTFHSPAPLLEQARELPGGRRISPHDPLLPVLLAGPVALGGWLGAKLALAGLAGLLAAMTAWVAHRRFGVPFAAAATTAAVFGASPPLSVYATQVYPEIPAALVLITAVGLVSAPHRRFRLWVVVGLVNAAGWLSVKYLPAAAAVAVLALARAARAGDRRGALGAAVALAVSAAVFAAGHAALYGGLTPYAAGSHFREGELTVIGSHPDYAGRSRRLVGLLVDREFGLVPWQPAFVLAPVALGALLRRRPDGWAVLVAPLAGGWLVATFVALTMHGWWWPGRQLVAVVPCVAVAVAAWAGRVPTRLRVLAVLGAIGVANFAWVAVEGLRGSRTLIVDFARTADPLYRAWRFALPDGRSSAPGELARHAAWSVVLAAAGVVGMLRAGSGRAVPGRSPDAGSRSSPPR